MLVRSHFPAFFFFFYCLCPGCITYSWGGCRQCLAWLQAWLPALQVSILKLMSAFGILQRFSYPAEQITQVSWNSLQGPIPGAASLPHPGCWALLTRSPLWLSCFACFHLGAVASVWSSVWSIPLSSPGQYLRTSQVFSVACRPWPMNLSQEPTFGLLEHMHNAPLPSRSLAHFPDSCTTWMLLIEGILSVVQAGTRMLPGYVGRFSLLYAILTMQAIELRELTHVPC